MKLVARLALTACLGGCAATAQMNTQPWPATEKQKLVQACREHIWQRAETDYLAPRGGRREQLPPDFRGTMRAKVEPSLAGCECFFDQLEREWSYEQLASRRTGFDDKLKAIRESGVCARPGQR